MNAVSGAANPRVLPQWSVRLLHFLLSALAFGTLKVSAATSVGGVISSDTVLSPTDSASTLTANMSVANSDALREP
jgi:hypothetical protein